MLRKPKFFATPSAARLAVKAAVKERAVGCSVNDVLVRVDPDEGMWFGIVSLDTERMSVLTLAQKLLPEFRVIGEPVQQERGRKPQRAERLRGDRIARFA